MPDNIFQPLPPEQIKEQTDSIGVGHDLISVTLTDGAVLIGELAKYWEWDGKVISLGFNTEEGRRYGQSHIVDIPIDLIADIRPIPLDEASIPKIAGDDPRLVFLQKLVGFTDKKYSASLPVRDYPNPLATIICRHNLQVIEVHNLRLLEGVEKALSQDAIPPEGIFMKEDFLFYADWDFFRRQVSRGSSVGAGLSIPPIKVGVTKYLSPSLQKFVWKTLKAKQPSEGFKRLQGCILVPESTEDTEIEGEKCIVALCVIGDESNDGGDYPVLIKPSCIGFPLEFFGRVNSVLTFYGALLPAPLNFLGRSYEDTLLARAIAYLEN